jgi:hypothetical protein
MSYTLLISLMGHPTISTSSKIVEFNRMEQFCFIKKPKENAMKILFALSLAILVSGTAYAKKGRG